MYGNVGICSAYIKKYVKYLRHGANSFGYSINGRDLVPRYATEKLHLITKPNVFSMHELSNTAIMTSSLLYSAFSDVSREINFSKLY